MKPDANQNPSLLVFVGVALPQYKKAVEKVRITELLTLAKHIKDMQTVFYLANGIYAANCEDLNMDIPNGYALTEEKILWNSRKHFALDCERGQHYNTNDYRVAGLFLDKSNTSVQSAIELKLPKNPAGEVNICSGYTTLFKEICKSMCGKELTNNESCQFS